MNIPEIFPVEDLATDTIVTLINTAKFTLGERLNLFQLAKSRSDCLVKNKISLFDLEGSLVVSCEKIIHQAIQTKWKLAETFMYFLTYMGSSVDETAHYLYFEAVFSQPITKSPVPLATATVFFRVKDTHLEPVEFHGVPQMTFRIEGGHVDYDVSDVLLNVDWLLAVIQTKMKFFRRVETLRIF